MEPSQNSNSRKKQRSLSPDYDMRYWPSPEESPVHSSPASSSSARSSRRLSQLPPLTSLSQSNSSPETEEDESSPQNMQLFPVPLYESEEVPIFSIISKLVSSARSVASFAESTASFARSVPRSATNLVSNVRTAISGYADTIISNTNQRKALLKIQEAQTKMDAFEKQLKTLKKETTESTESNVLRMIAIEMVIESIMSELLLNKPSDIEKHLLTPMHELNSHYEHYFGWEGNEPSNIDMLIDSAYKEFKRKQDIRQSISIVFVNNKKASLNDAIDELITLYIATFKSDMVDGNKRSLPFSEKSKLLQAILREPETRNLSSLSGNKNKPILTAIKYESLMKKLKDKNEVNMEIAELREPAQSTSIDIPAAPAMRVGHLTRDMDIHGNADASFLPPLTANVVFMGSDSPARMRSRESLSPDSSDYMEEEELPVVGKHGEKTPAQMDVFHRMQMAALTEKSANRSSSIRESNLLEKGRQLSAQKALKQEQKARQKEPAIATHKAKMYASAADATTVLNDMHERIKNVRNDLNDPDSFLATYSVEQKQKYWETTVHTIFAETYVEMKKLQENIASSAVKIEKYSKKGGVKRTRKLRSRKSHRGKKSYKRRR